MKNVKGRVAIVTGAASGIGQGMVESFVQAGMKVVLADVEKSALDEATRRFKSLGADVIGVVTDISKPDHVEVLARKTLDTYGEVHILCNNAGVTIGSLPGIWANTLKDWQWILGVNVMGVVHGLRTFIPIMLKQDMECHIVNTSSVSGLTASTGNGLYAATKHAIISISETLYHELRAMNAKIGVSVLCPGWVNTRIFDSERNRPAELQNDPVRIASKWIPYVENIEVTVRKWLANGVDPREVGDHVLKAIRADRFYILTHPDWKPMIRSRLEKILDERPPILSIPPARGSDVAVEDIKINVGIEKTPTQKSTRKRSIPPPSA
jgi:NAD(P)-dependent dehydrogenase (short-subunit alcohol dehydrogenase family)